MTTTVLHLIPTLSRGGAGRALLTATAASAEVADLEHTVVSLREADPLIAAAARERGLKVLDAPAPAPLRGAIEAADIVQVHFWNSPELYELLFTELPAMRLLVWSHVAGEHPPQVLVPELIEFADRTLASSSYTIGLQGLRGLEAIPAVAGWDRVEGIHLDSAPPFTVGYIGTLDFGKLHPAFVSMSARMQIPGGRFLVCGTGGALPVLRRQAAEQGVGGQFDFRGYVEDIRSAIATMDVFGYPLSDGNSTASELVLQEVMYAGVPPVVLGSGGARLAVLHEETGLVAEDEAGYRRAVEHLYAHPEKRRSLGAAAKEHARRTWSPVGVARRWAEVYEGLMARPKRSRSWPGAASSGAGRFAQSLGHGAPEFRVSMEAEGGDEVLAADRRIAGAKPVLCTGGGGILFYRDHYPDDGWLRMWAGLALHRQGRRALAAGEFAAAIQRGRDEPRVHRYLARAKLGARLRDDTCTVAYMGASVTAQKDGYRPRLHAMLESRLGREHVMVNAGTGAIGSIGGLFLMDGLVLHHRPDLCFIEYATSDTAGTTPPELVGPVVEEIVLRLRQAGCEPCILLLPRAERDARVTDLYRQVAAHHGVALIDVAASLDARELTEACLRDVVHSTPFGAEAIAGVIAGRLESILDPTGTPAGGTERLFDRSFREARLLPATTEQLRDPGASKVGRFRLFYPYVEIEPGGCFHLTLDGELVGLVVVVGPESGVIRVGSRELTLFDRWCWYDRLSTVVLEPGFASGAPVTLELTDRQVDHSVCDRPLEDPGGIRKNLKVIGFMVRPC